MTARKWFRSSIFGMAYSRAGWQYYAGWLAALALIAATVLASLWGVNGMLVGLLAVPAFIGLMFMLTWTNFYSMKKQ